MAGAFAAVVKGLRKSSSAALARAGDLPATERDLPPAVVLMGVTTVILVAGLVPGVFGGGLTAAQRMICAAGVGVFGLLFVAVAARIVGIVGVTSQPTSGITLVTLIGIASVFAANGWTSAGERAAVLTVGTIVAIAASKAGDISQDLKTGWLVGATPAKQQFGQLIGAAFACWAVAAAVMLLGATYGFGSQAIPAPQATLMKTIVEGVLAGSLPWELVGTGAGVALSAILCGVNGLAFAIGVYLPLASMLPIYVGGCVRAAVENANRAARGRAPVSSDRADSNPGVLAASGYVAGEGLSGVLIALLAWQEVIPKAQAARLGGVPGELAVVAVTAGLCVLLWRAGREGAAG
jgi:putative OPT family oligopeptide transporter